MRNMGQKHLAPLRCRDNFFLRGSDRVYVGFIWPKLSEVVKVCMKEFHDGRDIVLSHVSAVKCISSKVAAFVRNGSPRVARIRFRFPSMEVKSCGLNYVQSSRLIREALAKMCIVHDWKCSFRPTSFYLIQRRRRGN